MVVITGTNVSGMGSGQTPARPLLTLMPLRSQPKQPWPVETLGLTSRLPMLMHMIILLNSISRGKKHKAARNLKPQTKKCTTLVPPNGNSKQPMSGKWRGEVGTLCYVSIEPPQCCSYWSWMIVVGATQKGNLALLHRFGTIGIVIMKMRIQVRIKI